MNSETSSLEFIDILITKHRPAFAGMTNYTKHGGFAIFNRVDTEVGPYTLRKTIINFWLERLRLIVLQRRNWAFSIVNCRLYNLDCRTTCSIHWLTVEAVDNCSINRMAGA